MKIYTLIFIIISFVFNAVGQDLIITNSNDSISCKILDSNTKNIRFRVIESNKLIYKVANQSDIKLLYENYYTQPIEDENILIRNYEGYIINKEGQKTFCNFIYSNDEYTIYSESINGQEILKAIYHYNVKTYYPENPNHKDYKIVERNTQIVLIKDKSIFHLLQAHVFGGYSVRSGPYPYYYYLGRAYTKDLKNGFAINVNLNSYWSYHFGVGFKASSFRRQTNTAYNDQVYKGEVTIDTKIRINYFAPVISYKNYTNNRKFQVQANMGLGYIKYIDDNMINNEWLLVSGSTIGAHFDILGTYLFTENIGINIYGSYLYGKLSKLNMESKNNLEIFEFEKPNQENVGRIELGVGLTWAIFSHKR